MHFYSRHNASWGHAGAAVRLSLDIGIFMRVHRGRCRHAERASTRIPRHFYIIVDTVEGNNAYRQLMQCRQHGHFHHVMIVENAARDSWLILRYLRNFKNVTIDATLRVGALGAS